VAQALLSAASRLISTPLSQGRSLADPIPSTTPIGSGVPKSQISCYAGQMTPQQTVDVVARVSLTLIHPSFQHFRSFFRLPVSKLAGIPREPEITHVTLEIGGASCAIICCRRELASFRKNVCYTRDAKFVRFASQGKARHPGFTPLMHKSAQSQARRGSTGEIASRNPESQKVALCVTGQARHGRPDLANTGNWLRFVHAVGKSTDHFTSQSGWPIRASARLVTDPNSS
jgi:hypothetical protein